MPSALMMSWSAVAMFTSVCTTSIGASEPTSILILVMRFSSTAIALASSFTFRLSKAYTRSQYACSVALTVAWTLRTKSW